MFSFSGCISRVRRQARQAADGAAGLGQSDFTLRAVVLGLLIGCLLCFTNLYFGLQTGWISMMSLQSALIGYLLSKFLPKPMSAQENVVLQTTAVATGTMPLAAGFVGILPALGLLDEERDGVPPVHLSWIAAVGWSCAVAFFGVFLSPPLRKQVIIEEQLAFPSGTATGQLISVLHQMPPPDTNVRRRRGYNALASSEEDESIAYGVEAQEADTLQAPDAEVAEEEGWSALSWSFAASGIMTLAAYFFPVVFAVPLFGTYLASEWLWSFTPSLSYIGQGIIMGFPTTLSMNLGMLVGWGVLSPLAKYSGWAPGPVGDMTTGARGWILWVSLAIMCSDSVVSLVPVVYEIVYSKLWKAAIGLGDDESVKESKEVETEDRLVPMRWVVWGVGGSIVLGTVLVWLVFGHEGIKPWATLIGFIMGGLLSVLGYVAHAGHSDGVLNSLDLYGRVRALGETDLNPVSGLGKISQLFFAWIQPGNIVANIIAGGVAEAGAQQAGDLMQDLKTGHLIRASPRAQFFGQLIGSCLSIVVTTTAYTLYQRAYEIPGPSFPAPTAYVWLGLARLLRDGDLPEKSGEFMVISAILFSIIAALKAYAVRRGSPYAKWVPSGVAFAIGFLNTPSFSLARLIGGVAEHVYYTRVGGRERGGIRLIIVASGFVLGEGVVSVVALGLKTLGVGVASCWGCGHGLCGGCPAA
ncbi:OPT oligopeptide transporter [Trametes elegans]|nr:OPT oligopeptide transporter [Trametes elegans]